MRAGLVPVCDRLLERISPPREWLRPTEAAKKTAAGKVFPLTRCAPLSTVRRLVLCNDSVSWVPLDGVLSYMVRGLAPRT